MAGPAENTTSLFAQERRRTIVEMVHNNSKVLVTELAELLDVTPATIRADLRYLESQNLLERTHGGAIPPKSGTSFEVAIGTRMSVHREEKMRIAAKAAEFVHDGDFILIDSGTTARYFMMALSKKKNLSVLTNDVIIANIAEGGSPDTTVIMVGGTIRNKQNHTQGIIAVDMLKGFYAPRLFLSTDAFSPKLGFSTFESDQAIIKRTMLSQSEEHILLTDSSKLGINAHIPYAHLDDLDVLITDTNIQDNMRTYIQKTAPKLDLILV